MTASRRGSIFLSVLVVLGLLLAITRTHLSLGGNEISRFSLIEALVDHHQWTLEHSTFGRTSDVIKIDGKVYSNKPPFLAVLGAGVYFVVENVFGWRFTMHRELAVFAVTLLSVGSFSLAFLLLLFRVYRDEAGLTPLLPLLVVLGTTLLSFSGTMNNHTPAACFLLWGLWEARRANPFRAGLALGGCVLLDPVFASIFGVCIAIGFLPSVRIIVRYGLGALPGLLLWFALNAASSGSIVPVLLTPARAGVDKSWSSSGFVLPEGPDYSFHALLGQRGFFVYSPIFLVAILALPAIVRRLRSHHLDRCIILAVAATIGVHMIIAGGYGGWAYGYRYLIPLVAPFALLAPTLWSTHATAFTIAFVPSFILALIGAYAPWVPSYQCAHFGNPIAARAKINAGVNLACFLAEHRLPGASALERWFISTDPMAAREYEEFFFRVRGDAEDDIPPR